MANATAAKSRYHGTSSVAAEDVITMPADYEFIEFYNRDASSTIFFTTDNTAATSGGDGCYVVAPGDSLTVPSDTRNNALVRLYSPTAAPYSIAGINA